MALVDINWRPSTKELRVFAVLQLGFCALVAWLLVRQWAATTTSLAVMGVSLVVASAGLIAPRVLRPIYLAWMVAVWPIGWVVSHLTMAAVFYLVISPIGLIMKACGHDPMQRTIDRTARSYWRARPGPSDSRRYFRQH
jgi:hypothetical protein